MLCIEGGCLLAGGKAREAELAAHDAAEVTGPMVLSVTAGAEGAHVLVVEMAGSGGGRRDL